jgi:alkanesulfonate monooxygenase
VFIPVCRRPAFYCYSWPHNLAIKLSHFNHRSDAAIRALPPHVDVFMLWGEPLKDTTRFMDRVRQEAALSDRTPTFSLSTRPILAATEGEAWDRARAILERVLANRGGAPPPRRQNIGSQRLLQAAAEAEVHDTCLWMSLAVATGASGNSTALVGTPETVAKAMLEYYKLGATSLLIRGYDPRPDAIQYGEELIPRLRELVADYDAASCAADIKIRACTLDPNRPH